MQNTAEDNSHAAQGHKANLSNPDTSEESKQHSKEVLSQLGGEQAFYGKEQEANADKNPSYVQAGLKANINTPADSQHYVSEEGRQAAQEKLDKNF